MKPIELFWMTTFGTIIALPARPSTVTEVTVPADPLITATKSPYATLIEAQTLPAQEFTTIPATLGTNILALQTLILLTAMLIVLRWAPPAPVVLRKLRQAAAALARSRTRVTIARNPFDL